MPEAARRVRVLTLALEEIRALPRQSFALGVIAVASGLLAPLAAFGLDGPNALSDYLIFLWFVAELAVAIVVAARVASVRRTRFVDSLYTTPLEQRTWLAAQALVGAFLAILVLAAQLPFVLLHVALVGVPPMLVEVFLGSVAVAAFAVAFGLFCGVAVGGAGPGAAAGIAGGVGFVSFVLFMVHGALGPGPHPPAQAVLFRLGSLSPLTLALEAAGIDIFDMAPSQPWRPVVGLGALVVGFGAAAWIAYTRAQAPLGWEGGRLRGAVAALIAVAVLVPLASADPTYVEVEEDLTYVFAPGEHTRLAFVPKGAPITDDSFTRSAYWDWPELDHGTDHELDLLVMLLVPEREPVRGVRVELAGSDEVRLVSGGSRVVPSGTPDGSARASDNIGDEPDASAPLRPVYRVPVVLRAVEANALQGSRGLVEVLTTFLMDGRSYESHARVTIDSNIPGASTAILLAGAPLPLAAFGALVRRRIRTR